MPLKVRALLSLFLLASSLITASTNVLERFAPNLSTNTPIFWQIPSNSLPASLWIYRRLPPQPFSIATISNAFVIASMRARALDPRAARTTNDFWLHTPFNCCGMAQNFFGILPAKCQIFFWATNQNLSSDDLPDDDTLKKQAFRYASLLGLPIAQLVPQNIFYSSNVFGTDVKSTNAPCGKGIVLSRKLDGVIFFNNVDADDSVGFTLELGNSGEVRAFYLAWPNLERSQHCQVASPQEITRCLQARRIFVLPDPNEENYFARIRLLSTARKFIITKIVPRYHDMGSLAEPPTNNLPSAFLVPFAEADAMATCGTNNVALHFISPILLSEVTKLLRQE